MARKNTETEKDDIIIDLDADQVIEDADPPPPPPLPPSPPPVTQRKRQWPYLAAALLAGAVGGGWLYKDVLGNYLPSDQTVALTEKLTALETSNTALREKISGLDKLTVQLKNDVDGLEAKNTTLTGLAEAAQKNDVSETEKLTALELSVSETKKAIADLAARPPVVSGTAGTAVDTTALTDLQNRLVELEKDVASLKSSATAPGEDTTALSQSLSDLKTKIAVGTGYRDELTRLQLMVPAAAGLDVLQQHAALGLPDARGLGAELKSLIATLPKPVAATAPAGDESLWDGLWRNLGDLVTIRTEGEKDWAALAATASVFADQGDLPKAIESLTNVDGEKPQGLQQWIDRAQGRLAMEQALQAVADAVLRVIAAKG